MKCVVCKGDVDRSQVIEEFEHLFERADYYGIESLTEHEQVVVDGCCCSHNCYEKLA